MTDQPNAAPAPRLASPSALIEYGAKLAGRRWMPALWIDGVEADGEALDVDGNPLFCVRLTCEQAEADARAAAISTATGYLGKREFHGPLAKHSPYSSRGVMCVCCSRIVGDRINIKDEICNDCYRKGWRPPERQTRNVFYL